MHERHLLQMLKLQQRHNRVFISIMKFDTHLVVGSAVAAGDVAASHSLAATSEISYTLAEFSNEFKKEDQEGHDFCNVFNAQMKTVAKRNCINITGKE